ncbi:MAG: hypothetical protein H0U86_14900 [Chloroflexi bacterium]|nr:hypothetical protein [Chloroflexota bacterium]
MKRRGRGTNLPRDGTGARIVGALLITVGVFLAVAMYSSLPGIFIILGGIYILRRVSGPNLPRDENRLPSRPSSGHAIGGFMSDLEHVVTGQARAVPQIEEQYRQPWAAIGVVTIGGLDEPIERPKPSDRSGARL